MVIFQENSSGGMMIFKKKMAFTLNELVIVVVLIGVLAAIALPSYFRAVEKSSAREAKSALGLIHAGQKIYHSRNNYYLGNCGITVINSELGLNLEASYWSYCANDSPPNDIGTATHLPCVYTMQETGAITSNGSCPE